MKKVTKIIFLIWMIFQISISTFGQIDEKIPDVFLDENTRNEAINQIINIIKENYYSIEFGNKMEIEIRQRMAKKEYESIVSAKVLAVVLTRQLYDVSGDKQVFIQILNPKEQQEPPLQMGKEGNFGFTKIEIFPGNIGFLQINSLPPPEKAKDTLTAAMKFLQNTNALIIDLRENMGGTIPMVALMVSYFVQEKPVQLIEIDAPRTKQKFISQTVEQVDAPRYLGKPVYILTSQNTISGAEEFAYDMQALQRAKIIGENTQGVANPVRSFQIQNIFQLSVTFAKIKNLITGTNWEGVGVKPDFAAQPEKALELALDKVKVDLNETNMIGVKTEPQLKLSNQNGEVKFPDTLIGNTFQEFLQAFNSGNLEQLQKFHLSRLEKNEEGVRIAQENSKQDFNFFKTSGGLIPKKIINVSETKIQVVSQFKQRNETVLMTMEISPIRPYPIIGLGVEQVTTLK